MRVELGNGDLRSLPGLGGHHGAALVVDLEHQLGRGLQVIAEEAAQHEDHIAHQGDRIVPDDHPPGMVTMLLGLI